MKTWKSCCSCRKELPLEDFYNNKASSDGKTNKCKVCTKAYSQKYKKNNQEAVKKYAESYQKDYYLKNRAEKLQWQKDYRERNLEQRRAYDRVQSKQHYEANKDYYLEKSARRRALKQKACPPWIDEKHKARLKSVYKACKNTSERSGKPHHVDHIIPLNGGNVCGLHVWWNLQILPATWNLSKGNKYDGVF